MKILFILEHYFPYVGGAEQLFKSVAEGLADKGHEVRILTTLYDKKLPQKEIVNQVEIHRVDCINRFLFTVLSIPKAVSLAGDTDLIFTTSYTAAFPSWVAGFLKRKKRIIVFHEVWGKLWWQLPYLSFFQRFGFYFFEQFILKLGFHQFIAVSDFTKQSLIESGIPESKINRIYNGLNYNEFENYNWNPPKRFSPIYLGRLGVSKGLDLLILAAAKLAQIHPDVLFKFVLPTRPEAFLKTIKNEMKKAGLKKENYVIFHELKRDELFREISKSSCVVVPSYSEGFGFVAAEAIALGVPLISSQEGALLEVVSGQFVPMPEHTVEGLCQAFEKAMAGEWEQKKVKLFPFDETIEKYLQLIDNQCVG